MINPMIDVYGVFVPAFLIMALGAWFCLKVLHVALARIGFYKITAHPALTDLALFVLILTALSALFVQ
ncbi:MULTISPECIES: DUF1656 domain-containing protein [Thalassospira]|jgi:uncharacterized membrane protein (DUF373 family)|uniref:DUF1656 domain-containing protein n=1 Tax=Thalassospira xiamenensis TaxID=220697 RepID=A0ABR5Y5R0_9PROT|nr:MULTISPECIES: DUF1656 domain-containing protein [Thalassospira]KZD06518.1 hypothetical protein AUP40_09500 [Thalassospira xiamenensis]KZD10887.1 hypothetical protein AUP45_09935 [Thalassospira xiamenensis]MAB33867.1 DUF1656 domain-containing protein [Thalassospira sp.]MBA05419.1 DUF1656 domain-containing protein [Thalassospira sp.]MBL4843013.1 DUF1656 domain-containing protein [Thalassospira sp.]|tara:strand:- start:5604 stop:5807 length:204 start_codon:yes stop_codon:yes gene_type:complete